MLWWSDVASGRSQDPPSVSWRFRDLLRMSCPTGRHVNVKCSEPQPLQLVLRSNGFVPACHDGVFSLEAELCPLGGPKMTQFRVPNSAENKELIFLVFRSGSEARRLAKSSGFTPGCFWRFRSSCLGSRLHEVCACVKHCLLESEFKSRPAFVLCVRASWGSPQAFSV